MAYLYFFKKDGSCKWMQKEINENYPKYLREPIEYNGKKIKFYVILNWVFKKSIGANLKWINELKLNYVNTINELPEDAGIYVTGYDADLLELEQVKKKNIPIIEHPCPWIKKLRDQLYNVNKTTHQCIFLIDNDHLIFECYKYIFPEDIIIINTDNYKEEIKNKKSNKPIHFITYSTFRENDVKRIIDFINKFYYHPDNILNGYKKSLCQWTKQGLLEEIREEITNKKLDEIWIICSSEHNRSTKSIINEINENNTKSIIIKNEDDMPKNISGNKRIGILEAPIPLPKNINILKDKIKKKYDRRFK